MKKILAILGILLISLISFQTVFAQDFAIENPLGENASTIPALIDRITHFIFLVGVAIAPVMILVAAFYFMTARGDPDQVSKAGKIIVWTLVGVAIIYMSDILMTVIRNALGVTD